MPMKMNWNALSLEKCHSMKMDFHWGIVLSLKGVVSEGNVNQVT